ncbi:TonB-dependent receptor [Stenotrophomonas nematodicola]|uniref:TonB-dependent receptor n=1 Tax=Stenotrophomonas nematodicola TaxID=2656746 RepID=UPI003D9A8817
MNKMSRMRNRDTLSAAITAALFAAALAPAGAFAQQAGTTPSPDATTLDSVTVTGYRYAIEKSLQQKRDANAVVEVITAEDVGKFPDKNVADALQRVPGVVITRDGGEGKTVSVRGLAPDLTLTQLNGNYVATSETNNEATRSFNYTLLPSNMLSSAELFKSPEARIDEGGIGGTVILHTRRPLDMEANSGYVTVEGTTSDTSHDIDPQLSALYSWHSKDERFGVLVGVTQQKRTSRTMEASTEDFQWYGNNTDARDANGNVLEQDGIHYWWGRSGFNDQSGRNYSEFFMPTSVNFAVKEEERERKGGQFTFQFKPLDNLTLTANYFRFELEGNYTQNMLKIPEWNLARYNGDGNWAGGRMLDGLTFDPSGSIVTGAQYEKLAGKTYYCSEEQAAAAGLAPGGWGPDDCTIPTPQLTGDYSREKALSQTADLSIDWDISPLWKASFTGGRTWSEGGPSMKFRMAAKPRRQVNGVWQSGNSYSAWDLTGTPSATFSPDLQEQLNVFPGINYPAYINYLNQTYGGSHNRKEEDFVYNVDEKIYSGYFQANFRTERVRGNVGVRVVRTRQFAESSDSVEKFNDYFQDNAAGTPMGCNDPAAAPLIASNTGYVCQSGFVRLPDNLAREKTYALSSMEKTYTDFLPSFNIAWDITDSLVLRGAASKVIARPGYTSIAYPGGLSYVSEEYSNDRRVAGGTDTPGWYGSGSNKNLQPFEATQYDLGLEWYFRPGSVAGVALFRKDISNFTVPVVRDQQMNVGGQSVTVQKYSTQANGQDGVSQGVELYGQYTFDIGLGIQANYTYNDTNLAAVVLDGERIGSSPLVGSAKNQANVTVFYENEKFLARASFNRRGEVVGGLNNGLTQYSEPYDQLDLNAAYNITDALILSASVLNATKSEQRVYLGNDSKARLLSNLYSGRQLYLGMTWKF